MLCGGDAHADPRFADGWFRSEWGGRIHAVITSASADVFTAIMRHDHWAALP